VLPFDEMAGLVWARQMAEGKAKGRPRNPLDMIIAAVAEANDCVLVTENEGGFAGLKIVNPLRSRGRVVCLRAGSAFVVPYLSGTPPTNIWLGRRGRVFELRRPDQSHVESNSSAVSIRRKPPRDS